MSDDQFERLLTALDGADDWIVTLTVSMVSVIVGFLLSLAIEGARRRWQRGDDHARTRSDARARAGAWAYRLSSAPAQLAVATLVAWNEASGEVIIGLTDADASESVGGWYIRKMNKLVRALDDGSAFADRVHEAYSVSHRLRLWANGDEPASAFHPDGDDAWDERFAQASATIG